MAKYSKKAQDSVEQAMHERKHGQLRSGRSGKKVTSRKQAIAIGLSEAREKGAKVPSKRGSTSSGGRKKSAAKGGKTSGSSRSSGRSKTAAKSKRTSSSSKSKKKTGGRKRGPGRPKGS
jgi:hypothetical protein